MTVPWQAKRPFATTMQADRRVRACTHAILREKAVRACKHAPYNFPLTRRAKSRKLGFVLLDGSNGSPVEGDIMERREFVQLAAGAGAVLATGRAWAFSRPAASHFGLHPFIESHPEAVFVLRTSVADRKDAAAKQSIGKTLARQLFTLQDAPGIPLSSRIAIKPNITHNNNSGDAYAIITDREFLGGMIDGMKETGFPAGRIYVRDGMGTTQTDTKYQDMAARTGVHYDDSVDRETAFKDCPGGVVFKRVGYMGPFMYPDAYLINVAKFKTHAMGLTLCVKNLQGLTVRPYLQFCEGLQGQIAGDFQPDARKHWESLHRRHQKAGIPRWDHAEAARMEMWAQRALDNVAVVRRAVGLHVIEGISGQNGNAFTRGPGPGDTAEVFLTNLVLFGKDPFRLDVLGHWLAGHEPGNFGLFHLAKERGLSTALDPRNIPIYLWQTNGPKLTPLADLEKLRLPERAGCGIAQRRGAARTAGPRTDAHGAQREHGAPGIRDSLPGRRGAGRVRCGRPPRAHSGRGTGCTGRARGVVRYPKACGRAVLLQPLHGRALLQRSDSGGPVKRLYQEETCHVPHPRFPSLHRPHRPSPPPSGGFSGALPDRGPAGRPGG